MATYRIVEQPRGVFRVERKGWFFWGSLCFFKSEAGKWLMARGEPYFFATPVWFPPTGAVHSFGAVKEATEVLTEAHEETGYQRVVAEY